VVEASVSCAPRPLEDGPGWLENLGTAIETTESQLQIHDYLDTRGVLGARILHVGIGCSTLAQRYKPRGALVTGVTLHPAEARHANGLASYVQVVIADKHAPDFCANLPAEAFDVIVDNNPASFACCRAHLLDTFRAYARALTNLGEWLVEMPRGTDWTARTSAHIKLERADLDRIAIILGLRVFERTARVFAFVKGL